MQASLCSNSALQSFFPPSVDKKKDNEGISLTQPNAPLEVLNTLFIKEKGWILLSEEKKEPFSFQELLKHLKTLDLIEECLVVGSFVNHLYTGDSFSDIDIRFYAKNSIESLIKEMRTFFSNKGFSFPEEKKDKKRERMFSFQALSSLFTQPVKMEFVVFKAHQGKEVEERETIFDSLAYTLFSSDNLYPVLLKGNARDYRTSPEGFLQDLKSRKLVFSKGGFNNALFGRMIEALSKGYSCDDLAVFAQNLTEENIISLFTRMGEKRNSLKNPFEKVLYTINGVFFVEEIRSLPFISFLGESINIGLRVFLKDHSFIAEMEETAPEKLYFFKILEKLQTFQEVSLLKNGLYTLFDHLYNSQIILERALIQKNRESLFVFFEGVSFAIVLNKKAKKIDLSELLEYPFESLKVKISKKREVNSREFNQELEEALFQSQRPEALYHLVHVTVNGKGNEGFNEEKFLYLLQKIHFSSLQKEIKTDLLTLLNHWKKNHLITQRGVDPLDLFREITKEGSQPIFNYLFLQTPYFWNLFLEKAEDPFCFLALLWPRIPLLFKKKIILNYFNRWQEQFGIEKLKLYLQGVHHLFSPQQEARLNSQIQDCLVAERAEATVTASIESEETHLAKFQDSRPLVARFLNFLSLSKGKKEALWEELKKEIKALSSKDKGSLQKWAEKKGQKLWLEVPDLFAQFCSLVFSKEELLKKSYLFQEHVVLLEPFFRLDSLKKLATEIAKTFPFEVLQNVNDKIILFYIKNENYKEATEFLRRPLINYGAILKKIPSFFTDRHLSEEGFRGFLIKIARYSSLSQKEELMSTALHLVSQEEAYPLFYAFSASLENDEDFLLWKTLFEIVLQKSSVDNLCALFSFKNRSRFHKKGFSDAVLFNLIPSLEGRASVAIQYSFSLPPELLNPLVEGLLQKGNHSKALEVMANSTGNASLTRAWMQIEDYYRIREPEELLSVEEKAAIKKEVEEEVKISNRAKKEELYKVKVKEEQERRFEALANRKKSKEPSLVRLYERAEEYGVPEISLSGSFFDFFKHFDPRILPKILSVICKNKTQEMLSSLFVCFSTIRDPLALKFFDDHFEELIATIEPYLVSFLEDEEKRDLLLFELLGFLKDSFLQQDSFYWSIPTNERGRKKGKLILFLLEFQKTRITPLERTLEEIELRTAGSVFIAVQSEPASAFAYAIPFKNGQANILVSFEFKYQLALLGENVESLLSHKKPLIFSLKRDLLDHNGMISHDSTEEAIQSLVEQDPKLVRKMSMVLLAKYWPRLYEKKKENTRGATYWEQIFYGLHDDKEILLSTLFALIKKTGDLEFLKEFCETLCNFFESFVKKPAEKEKWVALGMTLLRIFERDFAFCRPFLERILYQQSFRETIETDCNEILFCFNTMSRVLLDIDKERLSTNSDKENHLLPFFGNNEVYNKINRYLQCICSSPLEVFKRSMSISTLCKGGWSCSIFKYLTVSRLDFENLLYLFKPYIKVIVQEKVLAPWYFSFECLFILETTEEFLKKEAKKKAYTVAEQGGVVQVCLEKYLYPFLKGKERWSPFLIQTFIGSFNKLEVRHQVTYFVVTTKVESINTWDNKECEKMFNYMKKYFLLPHKFEFFVRAFLSYYDEVRLTVDLDQPLRLLLESFASQPELKPLFSADMGEKALKGVAVLCFPDYLFQGREVSISWLVDQIREIPLTKYPINIPRLFAVCKTIEEKQRIVKALLERYLEIMSNKQIEIFEYTYWIDCLALINLLPTSITTLHKYYIPFFKIIWEGGVRVESFRIRMGEAFTPYMSFLLQVFSHIKSLLINTSLNSPSESVEEGTKEVTSFCYFFFEEIERILELDWEKDFPLNGEFKKIEDYVIKNREILREGLEVLFSEKEGEKVVIQPPFQPYFLLRYLPDFCLLKKVAVFKVTKEGESLTGDVIFENRKEVSFSLSALEAISLVEGFKELKREKESDIILEIDQLKTFFLDQEAVYTQFSPMRSNVLLDPENIIRNLVINNFI